MTMAEVKSVESRQQLVDWVESFLGTWEESRVLGGRAAEIVVRVIETGLLTRKSGEPTSLPNPSDLLQSLDGREYQR
jgi:hypothetical protein